VLIGHTYLTLKVCLWARKFGGREHGIGVCSNNLTAWLAYNPKNCPGTELLDRKPNGVSSNHLKLYN